MISSDSADKSECEAMTRTINLLPKYDLPVALAYHKQGDVVADAWRQSLCGRAGAQLDLKF